MGWKRITTGTGFSMASRVQEDAVNRAEAARLAGDTEEVERMESRADNAADAMDEYKTDTYGS